MARNQISEIRLRRLALGLSQRALADEIGCSSKTIRNYEAGRLPTERQNEILPKLTEALHRLGEHAA